MAASLVHEDGDPGDPLPGGVQAPRTTTHEGCSFEKDCAALKSCLERMLEDGSLENMLRSRDAPEIQRVVPGASLPSKTPPPPRSPPSGLVVQGILNEPAVREEAASPRRGMRAPKHTMVFEDSFLESIDPELSKLGDSATTMPLEGEVGELATQLKRELLKMSEGELASGYHDLPPPAQAWIAQTEEVISEKGTRDNSLSVVDGQTFGEEILVEKIGDGAPLSKLHVGDRTPDFSGYSRLTPLILESISSRLSSLSKEEIRSENQKLRHDIGNLRSEIQRRRQEQLALGDMPVVTGT